MPERITYPRLLNRFAAIGPYLREELSREGVYYFDCFAVCVSAKPTPNQRQFWGWWLELYQNERQFSSKLRFGLNDQSGNWKEQSIPQDHYDEVLHHWNEFAAKLAVQVQKIEGHWERPLLEEKTPEQDVELVMA